MTAQDLGSHSSSGQSTLLSSIDLATSGKRDLVITNDDDEQATNHARLPCDKSLQKMNV